MTTKFEVGKEYLDGDGDRARCVYVNEWGAAFEFLSGSAAGSIADRSHSTLATGIWRPAPRTVERWIVESDNGHAAHESKAAANVHADYLISRGKPATVNGPFLCVAP